MSIEEFIAMVRSGQINYAAHYSPLEGQAILLPTTETLIPQDLSLQIIDCIRKHQAPLYYLFKINDATVCSNPEAHRASYVPDRALEKDYTRCMECTRIRKAIPSDEQLLADVATRVDLREKQS